MNFLRQMISGEPNEGSEGNGGEDEDEDLICRPPQYHVESPIQQEAVDAGSTVYVERVQLLLNGKPINSMDGIKATLWQNPEQYWTFMR